MAALNLARDGLLPLLLVTGLASISTVSCAPVTEYHKHSTVAYRMDRLPTTRAPEHDTLLVEAVRASSGLRVRVLQIHQCAETIRQWTYLRDSTVRESNVPALLLEGAVAVTSGALTIAAAREASREDATSTSYASVLAGAGGVAAALSLTALLVDIAAARDSVEYRLEEGEPLRLRRYTCAILPLSDALVSVTLADGSAAEGITNASGEAFVPGWVSTEVEVSVDGRAQGKVKVQLVPCR